jgi:hypothetical protein
MTTYTIPPGAIGLCGTADQFRRLVQVLGPLPPTYVLRAEDGDEEIRLFRWPYTVPTVDLFHGLTVLRPGTMIPT